MLFCFGGWHILQNLPCFIRSCTSGSIYSVCWQSPRSGLSRITLFQLEKPNACSGSLVVVEYSAEFSEVLFQPFWPTRLEPRASFSQWQLLLLCPSDWCSLSGHKTAS